MEGDWVYTFQGIDFPGSFWPSILGPRGPVVGPLRGTASIAFATFSCLAAWPCMAGMPQGNLKGEMEGQMLSLNAINVTSLCLFGPRSMFISRSGPRSCQCFGLHYFACHVLMYVCAMCIYSFNAMMVCCYSDL